MLRVWGAQGGAGTLCWGGGCLGAVPCCISAPIPNQKLFSRVKLFSTTSEPGLQGWASYHSYGLNLQARGKRELVSQDVDEKNPKEQENRGRDPSRARRVCGF